MNKRLSRIRLKDENSKYDIETAESNLTFALSIFLLLLIPLTYFTLAQHFYYQQPWIDNLSYMSADVPGYVELKSEYQFGIHFFGDYLLPHYWAESLNPWIEKEIVTYPPVAIELFRAFRIFPYRIGIVIYETCLLASLISPIAIATRRLGKKLATISTLTIGCLSGPTLIALDRGNIVGILPILYFMFGFYVLSGREKPASMLLAVAVSIKYFPIVLLSVLISLRRTRAIIVTISASFLLTMGVAFFYPGSPIQTLSGLLRGALPFINGDVSRFSCFNVSYTSGLWNVLNYFDLNHASNWVAKNSLFFAVGMSILTTLFIVFAKLPLWSKLVLALSMTTMITPTVYSYSMNWVIAAIGIVLLPTLKYQELSIHAGNEKLSTKSYVKSKFAQERFLKVSTILCLVLIAVPWPIALKQTVELGCRTSIVGVVAFFSVTALLFLNAAYVSAQNRGSRLGVERMKGGKP